MDLDMEESLGTFLGEVSNRAKGAKEKLEKGICDMKLKVDKIKGEKQKDIDSWEKTLNKKVADILSKIKVAKLAQEQGVQLSENFSAGLQAEFQNLREEFRQNHFNIEIQSGDPFYNNLFQFCIVNYAPMHHSGPQQDLPQPSVIPQTQHIPKHDLLPRENLQPRSQSPLPPYVDVFEKYLRTYRNSKDLGIKPNLFDDIPDALKMDARICMSLPLDKKCTVVNFYAIISNNLNQGKDLNQIRQGLTNLAKVAFCVYLDPTFESIKGFNVDVGFYITYIADHISDVHEILTALGYETRQKSLELNARPENNARLERIGCELFILLEEMNDIGARTLQRREIMHHFSKLANESKIQPMQHQSPNLQATKQSSVEKSTFGFVKENPFENQSMEEPNPKLEEEDENYAFSELISSIDNLKEEKFKVSLATADPEQFAELAQKASSLPMHQKYKLLPIHNIISHNLSNGKDLGTIKNGLCGLFKFTFCIIMNNESPEISQLMVNQGVFVRYVSFNISFTNEVMQKLGYQQDSSSPMLLRLVKLDSKHEMNLMIMCCELLIAIQELTDFNLSKHGNPNEYFASQSEANPEPNPKRFSGKKIDAHPGTPATIESHSSTLAQSKSAASEMSTNQAEGGNVFGAGEPNNFMSQQLPPPHGQTQQLPQGQSQQLPPPHAQTQQFPPPSQVPNIQSNQAHYQQNPGQISHGQPDRSGQMPSQMPPENPTQRDFNVQAQGSHQMQTNSPHPIPSQHPQYFIRPRQMPNEVTQLHNDIRGILEKNITVSLHNTIPGELTYEANQCVKLAAQDKFSHSIVCEIIIASLNKNKLIKDVEAGLNRLALFTLNILTDAINFTCKVFEDGAGYFGNEISSRLSLASNILPFLGYTYDSTNRSNVLSNEILGMPSTTETLILIAADLLMAENDLKTFHKIGPAELIRFYELYPPTLPPPEMPPSNRAPQTQSPQTSGNQAQYSSTHTPLHNPGQQMQPHPGPSSDVPPQQSLRRTLEGQYNTGALVPQSTTHAYSPGMQSQRQNEPNPNNFNVAAHPSSAYNHPRTYPQDPHSNAPMMYPQTGRDVPSGLPFQQMQNQPVGLNPPSGASGWACPHCTFVNSSHSRVCEACARTPNSKVDQPAVQDIQSQTSQKRCRHCDRMNRMQEAVCTTCNTSFV